MFLSLGIGRLAEFSWDKSTHVSSLVQRSQPPSCVSWLNVQLPVAGAGSQWAIVAAILQASDFILRHKCASRTAITKDVSGRLAERDASISLMHGCIVQPWLNLPKYWQSQAVMWSCQCDPSSSFLVSPGLARASVQVPESLSTGSWSTTVTSIERQETRRPIRKMMSFCSKWSHSRTK